MLNLHRDTLAVAGKRAMDLTEGSDRERLLIEVGEQILHARVEILLDHSSHGAELKRLELSTSVPSGRSRASPEGVWSWIIESNCAIFGPAPRIRRSWVPSSSVSATKRASPRSPDPPLANVSAMRSATPRPGQKPKLSTRTEQQWGQQVTKRTEHALSLTGAHGPQKTCIRA